MQVMRLLGTGLPRDPRTLTLLSWNCKLMSRLDCSNQDFQSVKDAKMANIARLAFDRDAALVLLQECPGARDW